MFHRLATLVEALLGGSIPCEDLVDASEKVLVALGLLLHDGASRQLFFQFHRLGLQGLHEFVVDRTFHFREPVAQISVPFVVPTIR